MMDFYYQIKGKSGDGCFGDSWAWPPVISGMVSAKSKKDAKLIIEKEYERKFPLRVLKKDLSEHEYLLNIREISPEDERTRSLFKVLECKQCNSGFRVIDKYNDFNETNKGKDFCSNECSKAHYEENNIRVSPSDIGKNASAYIYKITNKNSGMVYIGKTTQVFTLRWYQHFYQHGNCKFHQAIKESEFSDWMFEIVEIIESAEKVLIREQFWIEKFDSIRNGYNSVSAASDVSDQ